MRINEGFYGGWWLDVMGKQLSTSRAATTREAFMRALSQNKKLRVHTGGHTFAFYEEEGKMYILRWFDYWLKGIDTGIMNEPRVQAMRSNECSGVHVALRERMADAANAVQRSFI